MGQLVAGTVGAVAGFFISGGNPMGALIGFNVGAGLYASTQSTEVQGQKIGDISTQTAEEGVACPIIWGRVRPIGGNLIAVTDPRIVKTTTPQSSGKGGGGKTKTTTEHVYRDYAIRICEGPATVVRAWRNNELVYDARGTDWGNENNSTFLEYGKFYEGTWDQLPDPALEYRFGVGNVPAHRGICYMVVTNELLDDMSGAVPTWLFEVERHEGLIATSRPYAIDDIESISAVMTNVRESPSSKKIESLVSSGASISSGLMIVNKAEYSVGNESIDSLGTSIVNGYLAAALSTYDAGSESIDSLGTSIVNGYLAVELVEYENYLPESINATGASITSGSLS